MDDQAHTDQQGGSERRLGRDSEAGEEDDNSEFAHSPPG